MRQRLPVALSVTALVVAVMGFTGLGEAALKATGVNADKVDGIDASRTPQARKLLALNRARKFPRSVFPVPFAGPRGPAGPTGPQGATGPAGPQGPPGVAPVGGIVASKVATGSSAVTNTSASYTDLAGASVTIDVPTGQTGIVIATFSGESACYGGGAFGYCSVRILENGSELAPSVGTDFAFDSTNNGNDTAQSWESHSVQRSSATLAAGTHTILVQWAVVGAGVTHRLDDWQLTAQLVRLT